MFYEVPIPTLIDLDTWETLPRHHGLYIKGLTFYLTGEISIPFETNLLSNPYLTHLLSGLDLPCYYLFDIMYLIKPSKLGNYNILKFHTMN